MVNGTRRDIILRSDRVLTHDAQVLSMVGEAAMSRAGQAGEVGSVFRCAAATHLAVHGLRSRPVPGLDLPDGVAPVRLDFETSDATDDIRVTFSDGRRAYVSAKRKVAKGSPIDETVAGWVAQAPTLGPDDLLVIAGEELVGPAKNLGHVLERHRENLPIETQDEKNAFALIPQALPKHIRELVLDRARVLHLPDSTGAGASRAYLASLMDIAVADMQGPQAVSTLSDLFHRQAGAALGNGIDDWVKALNDVGLTVIADRGGPAGMRAASRLAAAGTYRDRLKADAGRVDLSLLAEDLPPIVIGDLINGLEINLEGGRTSRRLLRYLRRWRRMLIVGQPGSGKSVALREIAAHCVIHPHAPVPIRVTLSRLINQQPERLTIDGIIDAAVADAVSQDQRAPLAEYLNGELVAGRAIVLCDGLDECGARAPWVAQQLVDILDSLHPKAGFVLTTRANAQLPAARLGLPRVELAPPRDLRKTIDRVLVACADTRVPEAERDAWLAMRRAWMNDANDQYDHLLTVPLLAILLTLVCASASDADLPKGRAKLLHRAVEQSVHRWEQTRGALTWSRPWSPVLSTAMLLDGFIVLGRILDGGATPSRSDALGTLREILNDSDHWAMPPAQAREVAEQILRFWDEYVAVFVVSHGDELTTRSKVFSEIATAMWATVCEQEQLAEWLSDALVHTDSDGAIALAAGLDRRTIGALLDVGANSRPEAALMVADLAASGVAELTPREFERTLEQLTSGVVTSHEGAAPAKRGPRNPHTRFPTLWDKTRDPGPWPFVQAACLLELPPEYRSQRTGLVAEAALDDSSGMIAAALCALIDAATDSRLLGKAGVAAVHAALAIPLPPESKLVQESRRRVAFVGGGRLEPGLAQVALVAAGRLDEIAEDSAERLFQIAMDAPGGIGDRIIVALSRAGVDSSRWRNTSTAKIRKQMSSHKYYRASLLEDISSLVDSDAGPSDNQFWSLADCGKLIAATGYHGTPASEFGRAFTHGSAENRRLWLDAIADAYVINKPAAAIQARYIQQMIEQTDESDGLSDDWFVVTAEPSDKPSLSMNIDASLTADQQRTLLSCLEAESDWIAWAAANVMVNVDQPVWDSQELIEKEMSSWPRSRAGLLYMVAIISAGGECRALLARAAASDSADYRYAARIAIAVDSDLDPDGSIMEALYRDADLSVRPKAARKVAPAPAHWTCNDCRAVNDVDVEDCPECNDGVRPDS